MADDVAGAVAGEIGQFETLSELFATHPGLQVTMIALVAGIIGIMLAYTRLAKEVRKKKFSYTRPHASRFVRVAILPFFGIALISSANAYIQTVELFDEEHGESIDGKLTARGSFAKILNTLNILVIGYTVANLVPIILTKRDKSILERADYDAWLDMRGFPDDTGLFKSMFRWVPPKAVPEGMTQEEFESGLETEEGRALLEVYRTAKGHSIGSYEELHEKPFEVWKESERSKYEAYFDGCVSGSNESGKKLRAGQGIEEIYPIDTWREEKRKHGYGLVHAGAKPPGHGKKVRKDLPKSVTQILPVGIFLAVVLGVVSWWGVDLIILATATGGMAVGIGLALQETMRDWFAYIMIRKDKIIAEGDRVALESGYNGYISRITPRVTYVRHALNESFAIIPTRQLVSSQIINYSKDLKTVPAVVDVGVSYMNDPTQVASILQKVGKRAMKECVDSKGGHLVAQKTCPYTRQNRPSCGCDRSVVGDLEQPVVRFNKFNDSSLDFSMWVYVRDYGMQFKAKTDMRVIMYEEFKKYDIRIPWPIRTVYQGDEKREAEEISRLDSERKDVIRRYGIGDITSGGADEE